MTVKFEPGGTLFLVVFRNRSQAQLSSWMLCADKSERLKFAPQRSLTISERRAEGDIVVWRDIQAETFVYLCANSSLSQSP